MVPSEAVPFVCLASVCRPLQCLISALTQAGGGGLLFRLLVPLRCGEGGALLSPSKWLRLLATLYGARLVLREVPVFRSSTKARTRLRVRFVPCPARAAQAARSLTATLSLGVVHLLPSVAPASVSARASRVRAPYV